MNWVMFPRLSPYFEFFSERWRPWVMVPVSFYGLDNKQVTENGTDSIAKSWRRNAHNISTRFTSGPNTITIRTMTRQPPLKETASSITTPTSSLNETANGTSKATDLTSSPQ